MIIELIWKEILGKRKLLLVLGRSLVVCGIFCIFASYFFSIICFLVWFIFILKNMKVEVNPMDTIRGEAFELWMSSPMPMVTLTKTFDVSRVVKVSKKLGVGFNALLCWCIARAAAQMDVFYLLPEQGKLFKYDSLAINVIVKNRKGGINSCDIPFVEDKKLFVEEYKVLTNKVSEECKSVFLEDYMIVGTSAMIQTELDCIVNQYTDKFCNPMVMWGKYRKRLFSVILPISFQFHHVQMDGGDGARFLDLLQREIYKI